MYHYLTANLAVSKFSLQFFFYLSPSLPPFLPPFPFRYSMKALSNRFMHLTNYSVNKKNSDFVPNSDETQCQGHKS